jgi:hypothetical protein
LTSEVKDKVKFGLFILDDMVEFLGPDVLQDKFLDVANQIIKLCASNDAGIRQAATYGIGMLAQHGKEAYKGEIGNNCLQGLKIAIE